MSGCHLQPVPGFDAVLVYSVKRLARNRGNLFSILATSAVSKIYLISVTEPGRDQATEGTLEGFSR